MSTHNDISNYSSTRGQDSASRQQLPGLHELLAPVPASVLHHPTRNDIHGTLPGLPSLTAPQHWQPAGNQPLPHQGLNGHSSPIAQFGAPAAVQGNAHGPFFGRQPYAAPIPRLPPPGHHDFRGSIPGGYADSPMDELRRDSTRSTSSASLQGTSECIGQQHFPGRGLCYVYRDGATCPTVIDGEVVNPLWGTTKAGKARKRLAQACLSCREKKIRCEPSYPRCAQCEKTKRECIMPSTQHGQPEAPSNGSHNANPALPSLSPMSPTALSRPGPDSYANSSTRGGPPSSKRRRSNENAPGAAIEDVSAGISMRPKYAVSPIIGLDHENGEFAQDHERDPRDFQSTRTCRPIAPEPPIWHNDPYEIDREGTRRLLDGVFVQGMVAFNHMVPHGLFRHWVKQTRKKSQDECMVLYTMLALGAAMMKDQTSFGKMCMERANASMDVSRGNHSFLVAQARIYMTQFAHAQGHDGAASDYTAAAVHVLRSRGLVNEDTCTAQDQHMEIGVFGMNVNQVAESKRRTVWAAYVSDHFSTAHTSTACSFAEGQIYLRHPCPEDIFEGGVASNAPFFQPFASDPLPQGLAERAITSPLAHITNIVRLIGDQSNFMFPRLRASPLSTPGNFSKDYEKFLCEIDDRLAKWLSTIPPNMRITGSNFRAAMDKSDFALSLSVTALYHIAVIKITRFAKHASLNKMLVEQNIQRAYQSAQEVLRLAGDLCAFGQNLHEGQTLQSIISPFLSYSVCLAVDTVCAGGQLRDLRGLLSIIMNGCTIMGTMGYVWPRAHNVHQFIEKKIADLQEIESNVERAPHGYRMVGNVGWRCTLAYRSQRTFEDDLIYGVDDGQYLRAISAM